MNAPFTICGRQNPRLGLSVLEFIGCLMALVGGIWLGAIYLGIDVHHVAYVALAESDLMEKVPENLRPEVPDSEKGPSQAELAQSVQHELVALRHEITALRDSQVAQDADAVPSLESTTNALADANDQAQQATLEYWQKLIDVVHRQATLQVGAESAATEGNATKVAALKARISRFTASAIHSLTTTNVDPSAAKFGADLAGWYEASAAVYEEAVQVWESPARGDAKQQLTAEWDRKETQNQNEGRLLLDRAKAVRDSLERRFGEGFEPIAGF